MQQIRSYRAIRPWNRWWHVLSLASMVNLPVLLHVNFSLRIESIVYLMTFGDGLSRFVTHRLGISNTNWHRFPTKDHLHEQNRSGSKSFLTFGRNFVKRLAAFLSLRCHDRDHTAMSRDASWLIGRAKALPYWAEGHQELHVSSVFFWMHFHREGSGRLPSSPSRSAKHLRRHLWGNYSPRRLPYIPRSLRVAFAKPWCSVYMG